MKNTLPPEIESLCIQKLDGQNVPIWPYVAAVTGHRSFARPGEVEGLPGYERETIKKAFQHELEQMARQWKKACGSVNAPFILLTGLADGADQLTAEAALELPEELNVKLAAILPMEKDLFRLTVSDKKRFDSLLERAYVTFALPLLDDSPEYRSQAADVDNPDTEPLRQMQYKELGKFLALHSHVLFALWDGIDVSENLVGGTSTTLHFKLEGNTDKQSQSDILTYTSVGPVVQFLLPRKNEENLKEPIAELENPEEIAVFYWSKHDLWDKKNKRYFFPSRKQMTEENRCKTSVSLKPELVDTLMRIGDLNQQSITNLQTIQKGLPQSRKYLFEERNDAEEFCDAETEALINHYIYADKLAEMFKIRMEEIVKYFLLGAALFLFLSSLLSSFWEIRQNGWGADTAFSFASRGKDTWCNMLFSMPLTTSLYWASIFLFTVFYIRAISKKNRVRFYRFRAVAEALRVQIFWRIADMNDCVSGYYRTHQLPETEWLRAAINGLDVLMEKPDEMNFQKSRAERLAFVHDVWINGQLKFFQNRLAKGLKAKTNTNFEYAWMFIWVILIIAYPFISTWLENLYHLCDAPNQSVAAFNQSEPALNQSEQATNQGSPCIHLLAECSQVLYGSLLVMFPIYGVWLLWVSIKKPQSELNRYKQMLFPYDRAILLLKPELDKENLNELLKSEENRRKLHTILRQLGTEAVSENASWYLSLEERKLNMPY